MMTRPGARLAAPAGRQDVSVRWRWWHVAVAVLLGGCSVYTADDAPAVPIDVPAAFTSADPAGAQPTPSRWWQAFGDATLNQLVEGTLEQGLDIKRAWARLRQAQAIARGAESGYWPQISADAQLAGSRTNFNVGEPIGTISNTQESYSLGVSAAYEVDLWGRVSNASDAADLDVQATRQDLESLAMTLSARVTDSWLGVLGERALLALLDRQVKAARTFVELVELRFAQGMASALEVYQQRQQLASLEALRPLAEARAKVLEHQLAVLMGRPPGAVDVGTGFELPGLPPPPASGLPIDLLGRRPDVKAAQLRVSAADHRVGAAIADRYPALRLSGRTGFQSFDLAELFSSWIWNLAANLVAPLVDGGRRSAEVERARAVVEDLVHGYGQAVLTAFTEVEDALVRESKQREHLSRLDQQLALARQSLDEARTRYVNGLSTYLNVLTALRTVQQSEQSQLAARRQLLSYRVALYRALGGDWTKQLGAPASAEVDRRTDTAPRGGPR